MYARGGFVEPGRHSAGVAVAAAAGLLVLVGVTAGAVVLLGSPSADDRAVPAASNTSASAKDAASRPSATGGADQEPDGVPSPSGPVGRVSHGVHSGDLRYFLLTPPKGADTYGDENGTALNADDIAAYSRDEAATSRVLKRYRYRTGAYRTYLTADGESEVTVRLARFSDAGNAAAYYNAFTYGGRKFTMTGGHPSRGYDLASGSDESTDALLAVSYQGDVHITITVTGGHTPDRTLLQSLLDQQYQRLAKGR